MKKTVAALAAFAALAAADLSHAVPLAWTMAWTYHHAATGVAGQTSRSSASTPPRNRCGWWA